MVEPALFGPLDTILAPVIEFLLLGLVVANMGTRLVAHRSHVQQAESGEESLSRYGPHEALNVVLVLASFYYLTLEFHSGMVLSVLVLGLVVTDFFEFEGRVVELRQDLDLERPKAALVGSMLVLLYAAYLSLFFLIEPFWRLIV